MLTHTLTGGTNAQSANLIGWFRHRQDGHASASSFKNDGSNTRGWFKLFRGGAKAFGKGKQMICPSAVSLLKHSADGSKSSYTNPAGGEDPTFDFDGFKVDGGTKALSPTSSGMEPSDLSYSMQVTLRYFGNLPNDTTVSTQEMLGQILTNTMDPGKPIAADRNPYSNSVKIANVNTGSVSDPYAGGFCAIAYDPAKTVLGMPNPLTGVMTTATGRQTYANELRRVKKANSRNHKQEGQNVAFLDGHAKWFNNPKAGVDEDSIWSNWVPAKATSGYSFELCDNGMVPCDNVPYTTGTNGMDYGKMRSKGNWLTDAVLIP
jgi:prepilin-type processing-associated H-X9-DG protein